MTGSSFKDVDDFKAQCGYEIDGRWYPRVTRIVDMKAKPALLRFYGAVGFDRARRISEKSAAEGTAVHEAAEAILLDQGNPVVAPGIEPAIEAFKDFLRTTRIEILDPEHIERRVHHFDDRYAGTIDALAQINGRFGLMDIKTSEAVYRDYNLQTAAYMHALSPDFNQLETRWILRIDQTQTCRQCGASLRTKGGRQKIKRPNGTGHLFRSNGFHEHYGVVKMCAEAEHDWGAVKGIVELHEIQDDWREDFAAFMGAKALWEWENRDWLKRIGYY